jgi:hypothetical protein
MRNLCFIGIKAERETEPEKNALEQFTYWIYPLITR